MTHGSLFSGIGGFDLAAEWMGWENVFHCEWDAFGQTILKYYWPNAKSYADITKTDFTIHRGTIDVLTGGFPCQPYSVAGKRKGNTDERHLWPEMLRAIREIAPRYVVGENVGGLLSWNGGLVFEQVHTDLEAEGYEVQAFILPACAKNAPHRRDRVWFIAHAKSHGLEGRRLTGLRKQPKHAQFKRFSSLRFIANRGRIRRKAWRATGNRQKQNPPIRANVLQQFNRFGKVGSIANAVHHGCKNGYSPGSSKNSQSKKRRVQQFKGKGCKAIAHANRIRLRRQKYRLRKARKLNQISPPTYWENFPTQSPVCGRNDGFPNRLDFKTVFKGIAKPRKPITFAKWRNASIKGYGNAIVPQLALEIFKAIDKIDKLKKMKRDYRPIFAICKANGLEYKDKVAEFTNGRTDSLTALSDAEFSEFKRQMHQLSPTEFVAKPGDKQRKKMIGIAKSMQNPNPVQVVDQWCITYGKYAKPLMQHTVDELNHVLHIYEHKVYKEFLEGIN